MSFICEDCKKPMEECGCDDPYCKECGQSFFTHNEDGSCVKDELESQESKHCDSGYINDIRFGDGGES